MNACKTMHAKHEASKQPPPHAHLQFVELGGALDILNAICAHGVSDEAKDKEDDIADVCEERAPKRCGLKRLAPWPKQKQRGGTI